VRHARARAPRELVGLDLLDRDPRFGREGGELGERRAAVALADPEAVEAAPARAQRLPHGMVSGELVVV
jgi:hypothetical protein